MSRSHAAGQDGPAGVARKPSHALVPRKASKGLAVAVVTAAFSIQLRKGGLLRPSTSSGSTHQAEATTTARRPAESRASEQLAGPSGASAARCSGSTSTAPLATALTPPTQANARPERVARHRTERSGTTSGRSTHGARASGHTSTEVIATSLSMRGPRA